MESRRRELIIVDTKQRFLRRKYLIELMDIVLREAAYHRLHKELFDIDSTAIWEWDQEEGESECIF